MAAPVARTSDYVRDSHLRTTFSPGLTHHTYFVSTPDTRRRRARTEEIWRRQHELGNGTFGRVWLERCEGGPRQGQLRAVKVITKGPTLSSPVDYSRELEAMAKFSHDEYVDCFVRFFGWYESPDAVFLAMEYFEHGDLDKHMAVPFPEVEANQITAQLAEGLFFMHDNQFAHRDLKPANVLIVHPRPDWWVKIGDFGISKRAHTGTALYTRAGTPGYMAPEVIGLWPLSEPRPKAEERTRSIYNASVDMWALGEITVRMITQCSPFSNPDDLFDYVVHKKPFPRHIFEGTEVSKECSDFIEKLMGPSPSRRMNASQAIAHPWVKSLRPSSRDGSPRSSMFVDASSLSQLPPTSNSNELFSPDDGSLAWSTVNAFTNIQRPNIPEQPVPPTGDSAAAGSTVSSLHTTIPDSNVLEVATPSPQARSGDWTETGTGLGLEVSYTRPSEHNSDPIQNSPTVITRPIDTEYLAPEHTQLIRVEGPARSVDEGDQGSPAVVSTKGWASDPALSPSPHAALSHSPASAQSRQEEVSGLENQIQHSPQDLPSETLARGMTLERDFVDTKTLPSSPSSSVPPEQSIGAEETAHSVHSLNVDVPISVTEAPAPAPALTSETTAILSSMKLERAVNQLHDVPSATKSLASSNPPSGSPRSVSPSSELETTVSLTPRSISPLSELDTTISLPPEGGVFRFDPKASPAPVSVTESDLIQSSLKPEGSASSSIAVSPQSEPDELLGLIQEVIRRPSVDADPLELKNLLNQLNVSSEDMASFAPYLQSRESGPSPPINAETASVAPPLPRLNPSTPVLPSPPRFMAPVQSEHLQAQTPQSHPPLSVGLELRRPWGPKPEQQRPFYQPYEASSGAKTSSASAKWLSLSKVEVDSTTPIPSRSPSYIPKAADEDLKPDHQPSKRYEGSRPYEAAALLGTPDPYFVTSVTPNMVLELISHCSSELKQRDHFLFLTPFRSGDLSTSDDVHRLLRTYFEKDVARSDFIMNELRAASYLTVTAILKWCWARIPGGVVGWKTYERFKSVEGSLGMSMIQFIDRCSNNEAHASIMVEFFDLLANIASYTKFTDLDRQTLPRMAAWWAFEYKDTGEGFHGGYTAWVNGANAMSHLFSAYLRSVRLDAIESLPLLRLVQAEHMISNYPPDPQSMTYITGWKYLVSATSAAPSPMSLLRRAAHAMLSEEDFSLPGYLSPTELMESLTPECSHIFENQPSQGNVLPSWYEFSAQGYAAPFTQPLPGGQDQDRSHPTSEPSSKFERCSTIELERAALLVWAQSLAAEETLERRRVFGQSVIAIVSGRPFRSSVQWVVCEELVSSNSFDETLIEETLPEFSHQASRPKKTLLSRLRKGMSRKSSSFGI